MPERSAITQIVQLGVEATPGTLVAATKKLQAVEFEAQPQVSVEQFRPMGFKFDTIAQESREWMQAALKGQVSYGEIIYLLGGVLNTPNPNPASQLMDGATATGMYKWIFEPSLSNPDTPLSFTIEQGSSVRAHKYGFTTVHELTLNHTREKTDIGGNVIARSITDGITLTPALPGVELVPATANQFDVFLDTTSGGLGTTKLTRLFSGKFTLNNRFGPFWVVDSSQQSFSGIVEIIPKLTYEIVVEADAQGMGLLTNLQKGDRRFLRIRSVGPTGYASRTVSDGVTNATTTVTSATAAFVAGDVGKAISGGTIPAGATIVSVTNGTTVVISAAATGSGSGITLIIGTSVAYSLTLDMAVNVEHIGNFSDQQGIYAVDFRLAGMSDLGWGKAIHAEVVNKVSAL